MDQTPISTDQKGKLSSLLKASLMLNSTLSMGDILRTLSLFATSNTGAERTTLYLMEEGGRHLRGEIIQGEDLEQLRLPVGVGIAGKVAETGEIINIHDAYQDPRFDASTDRESGFRTRSILAVPISDRKGKEIGVLQVLNKQRGSHFNEEDQQYLKTLAGHAAVAIQNARMFLKMSEEQNVLQAENSRLRNRRSRKLSPIGSSRNFRDAIELAEAVASSTANVLLRGESGCGKGVFAAYIHQISPRAQGPLVQLNCSAIPSDLLEAELFGIEKGVATGVDARRGRLEMANRGSCFLDEIGDMPLSAQAKILKVIEDRMVERVGGRESFPMDVRLIAATHRDLERAIREKSFREDLYYRLNVVTIGIPALRNRGEDVQELAQFFIQRFAKLNGRGTLSMSPECWEMLRRYPWPGNVRELENVIERVVVLSRSNRIEPSSFPPEICREGSQTERILPLPPAPRTDLVSREPDPVTLRDSMELYEKVLIENALRAHGGVRTSAARDLGISESNLRYKMKKFGMES